jgi:hypothetical protein
MFKAFLALILGVAALAGGAFYNYSRNVGLEADLHKPRPYATLSTPDVAALVAAYEQELARIKGSVAKAPGGEGVIDRFDSSDVGGKAKGFASFQRENERWKNQRGLVFEQEKTLAEARFEKSIRDRRLDDPMHRIWLRLTTF